MLMLWNLLLGSATSAPSLLLKPIGLETDHLILNQFFIWFHPGSVATVPADLASLTRLNFLYETDYNVAPLARINLDAFFQTHGAGTYVMAFYAVVDGPLLSFAASAVVNETPGGTATTQTIDRYDSSIGGATTGNERAVQAWHLTDATASLELSIRPPSGGS